MCPTPFVGTPYINVGVSHSLQLAPPHESEILHCSNIRSPLILPRHALSCQVDQPTRHTSLFPISHEQESPPGHDMCSPARASQSRLQTNDEIGDHTRQAAVHAFFSSRTTYAPSSFVT